MSTPTHHAYFFVARPEEVNGRLAAHGNKLLLNILNYTELLVEQPVITDESLQVFQIEVPADLVKVQQEGDRNAHLLWSGEKHGRSRRGELVTVQVRSILPFVTDGAGDVDPAAVAGAVFAAFAPNVQLGATILNVDDSTLASLGLNPSAAKAWAQAQVGGAVAAAAH